MKLFRGDQIKQIDEYTISDEPVESIDLMERAASQLLRWYIAHFDRAKRVIIFAGPGNNGGDGLALARLLDGHRYECTVWYINFTEKTSADWNKNMDRLKAETTVTVNYLSASEQFPVLSKDDIIIDAIFGTGLARPADGLSGEIIKLINKVEATVVSIDIPSGMFGEDNTTNDQELIVTADYTLSFQFPKMAFMFPENAGLLGEWIILPIGLSENAIRNISSPYIYSEKSEVAQLLKTRKKFDHKGNYGHGLLIAGSIGKMGAAVLGATAALRTGIGLITCHIPRCGVEIVQNSITESMVEIDKNENYFTNSGDSFDSYDAIGIGPGLGTLTESQNGLFQLLKRCNKPMVIDADGLNILSVNKDWYSLLPAGSILTPHPKEFERLAGKSDSSYIRLNKQIEFSVKYKCIIVLKGANTSVSTPEGKVYFNSTGNPGMATAGSGDTLTGIILSLLSQGYKAEGAAVLGVYLHGLAGDLAAKDLSYESIIATDIINYLGAAFNKLRES
jgi:NAD(P)H-hydrate epimerase